MKRWLSPCESLLCRFRSAVTRAALSSLFMIEALILPGCNLNVQEQNSTAPQLLSRQLTDDGWPKADVAWSSDGSKIAYSRVQTTSVLAAASADGSGDSSLEMGRINDNIDIQNFAISPNGQQVVYLSKRRGHLWLVNLQDQSERPLTPDDLNAHRPAWSPGGSRIAFSAPVPDSEQTAIWVVDVEANAEPVLVSPTVEDLSFSNPSWSPDEMAIVCESDSNEICVIELATQELFVLVSDTTDSIFYTSPAWSPVSGDIAYSVSRNGIQSIEIIPARGGAPRIATPQFRSALNAAWSSDGSQLAFNSRSVVWVASVDGTYLQQTDLSDLKPVWWPNSNSLVMLRQLSSSKIDVGSVEGAPAISLPNPNEAERDLGPAWYPDGREFVFIRHDVDVDLSQIRRLASGNGAESVLFDESAFTDRFTCSGCISNPAISPVDNSILFDDTRDIFLLLPDGQPPLNLSADIPHRLRQPAWSYDGKQIACVSDGRLIIYEFRARALVERRSITGAFANPAWSRPHPVFGSNIAVESGGGVFILEPEGGEPALILVGRHPAWSPDGTQLSLIQGNDVYIADVFIRE